MTASAPAHDALMRGIKLLNLGKNGAALSFQNDELAALLDAISTPLPEMATPAPSEGDAEVAKWIDGALNILVEHIYPFHKTSDVSTVIGLLGKAAAALRRPSHTQAAEAMREAAAKIVEAALPNVSASVNIFADRAAAAIRALPVPAPKET